jgi:VIT1/CCC1 family predicted Fe2+/Mn2+ transporter
MVERIVMTQSASQSTRYPLGPTERIGELLFGLIMVLTFTGSLSVADSGRDDVRTMLIGALGCNIAWGIIDAIFYLMGYLGEQARSIHSLHSLQTAAVPADAHRAIAEALPPLVAETLGPADYESLRQKLARLPPPPERPRLGKDAWLAALSVFLWVFVTTFPVSLPFFFFDNVARAMRFSNLIAIIMLFLTGYAYARVVGYRPLLTGFAMVVCGVLIVGMTIALGG